MDPLKICHRVAARTLLNQGGTEINSIIARYWIFTDISCETEIEKANDNNSIIIPKKIIMVIENTNTASSPRQTLNVGRKTLLHLNLQMNKFKLLLGIIKACLNQQNHPMHVMKWTDSF